jgi:hypothetical protein
MHTASPDQTLDSIIADLQPATAPAAERRVWPRRKKLLSIFVAHPQEAGEAPERAWIVDRSQGGMRILAQSPAPEGAVLWVRPTGASEDTPWVAVRVKSCHTDDEHQVMGCEFIIPSWYAYLLFS